MWDFWVRNTHTLLLLLLEHFGSVFCYTCVTLGHIKSTHSSVESFCRVKVLTLCQSGRWNTLGGRGRLNPCALCHHAPEKRKMVCPGTSVSVCLSFSLSCSLRLLYRFQKIVSLTALLVTFSLFCLQTLSPSTALSSVVSHSQLFSLSLRLSVAWLSLKSWLCVTRVSKQKLALVNTQLHHLNGLPPRMMSWQLDWLSSEPLRAGLSQGQVDMITKDVWCFTGFSS